MSLSGELAALITALCWAVGARLYRKVGSVFTPLAMTFWKGVLAIISLWGLVLLTGQSGQLSTLSQQGLLLLLLSGAIGIGIGDTCFFQALKRLGDSQTMIVAETLAPLFTALLALAFIQEWLSWQQWLGMALTIGAVDAIIQCQKKSTADFSLTGYSFAAIAALCQALGAVISRDVLTSTQVSAELASTVRLVGGVGLILPLVLLRPRNLFPASTGSLWALLILATLIGTVAALYLQMLAFSQTKAAVVQTLFALSIVMSLGIAAVEGVKISAKVKLATLVSLLGVGLLVGAFNSGL